LKYIFFFISVLFTSVFHSQEKVDVYFDFNEIKVNATSQSLLQNWIKKNPTAEIYQISGYCDTVGTNAYNKKLATERIRGIEKLLKSNKIAIKRDVQKVVVGEDFDTSINQAENRRVTFLYSTKEDSKSYASSLKAAKKGQYLELKGLNFFGGKDIVLPQSIPVLEELLEVMKSNENLKIEIHGHICCFTVDTENLSFKRAQAVYDYLVKNQIAMDRLSFKGFGSTMPIYSLPEKSEEERIANRRVEIFVREK
jgi:outer membrane protein OmpA-like peptidoglycan-associated protein